MADKPEVKTEEEKAQDFLKEFETLCKKHQRRMVVVPEFKPRDDGTFSVVLRSSVGRIPKPTT